MGKCTSVGQPQMRQEDILGPGDIVTYHLPHNLHHDTDTGTETEKRWCVHYHMTIAQWEFGRPTLIPTYLKEKTKVKID